MDETEIARLIKLYSEMPDEEVIEILLTDEPEYIKKPYEAYEILREEAKRRGLMDTVAEEKQHRREQEIAHEADQEFVVILTGTMMEIGMAKGLLEENGIPAFSQDEMLGSIAGPYVSSAGLGAVKLVVEKRDLAKARLILNEYLKGK